MKYLITIIILSYLSTSYSFGQKYCTSQNHFELDCITFSMDSFHYHKDGDFNNYEIKGILKRKNDTIIINPLIKRDSIQIVELIQIENYNNNIRLEIVNKNHQIIKSYESWTNYPLEYCCVLTDGFIILEKIPSYDTLIINPFGFQNYAIYLPIRDKLKLGNNYTFVIKEPSILLRTFEYETWFLLKKNKLIQLDDNKKEYGPIWKKNSQ